MNRDPVTPDLYVLDALVNDTEDLESVLRMLNSDTALGWTKEWGRTFDRRDVVEALTRLVARDLVEVWALAPGETVLRALPRGALPPGDYDDVYFAITQKGRLLHRNWDPAV